MKLTDALLGEHGALRALFDHVLATLPRVDTVGEIHRMAGLVASALLSHARIEDELLFPPIETKMGPIGPIVVMREEHRAIDEALAAAIDAPARNAAATALADAIEMAIPHFAKEEGILFLVAEETIGAAELERLGRVWARMRKVESPH